MARFSKPAPENMVFLLTLGGQTNEKMGIVK
jgi:hypothetical protein